MGYFKYMVRDISLKELIAIMLVYGPELDKRDMVPAPMAGLWDLYYNLKDDKGSPIIYCGIHCGDYVDEER